MYCVFPRTACAVRISGAALILGFGFVFSAVSPDSARSQTPNPYDRFGGGTSLPPSEIVGATSADVGVGASGSANYTIPITVPAGTTGVQPALTLQFSSPGGDGPIGSGGSIGGLSFVTRCPKDLYLDGAIDPVDYDGNDKFCLNGQRLVAINGTYGAAGTEYRTKTEEFSKIISYGDIGGAPKKFRVWRKSGEILEYGFTADSRATAVGQTGVRMWALNKLSDRMGNYSTYTYTESVNGSGVSNGDFRISKVEYTGNDAQGLTPYNSVDFEYETRPYNLISYDVG